MELKEGMYVRTKYGIAQITSIVCGQDVHFDNEELENISPYDGISKDGTYWRENIIGEPSYNIIDLIEVGDYVNGLLVQSNDYNFDKPIKIFSYLRFGKEDIKSIVTKEQMEQMAYKVGE